MGILVLTSTAGSPGVTTLAVGLALTWPRSVLLVDGDPGAHQSILGGFLAGQSAHGKGLLRVAEAHRDRRPLSEVVLDQTIPLAEPGDHSRYFLPGFAKPGSAALFAGVWPDLIEAFVRLDDLNVDVIVDAGRLVGSGLPGPLAEHAATLALILRTNLRAVLSAKVHLPALQERSSFGSDPAWGLVTVGQGEPYGTGEISRSLGLPVLGSLAIDPISAAHLSDGRPRGRKFEASPLVRSLHETSTALSTRMTRVQDRIGVSG